MPDNNVGGYVNYQREKEEFEYIEITLKVLVYPDPSEDAQVALALEMDLRGYGDSLDSALKELLQLVEAQISFAVQQKDPSLIHFPADEKFFKMFEQGRRASLHHLFGAPIGEPQYHVRSLRVPPPEVIAEMKNKTSWANG